MANELVQVPFHGDMIEAVQDEQGKVWVPLLRPCENLGLEYSSQYRRLKDPERSPWAVIAVMAITASDGKRYETTCLDRESVPMWLATIQANRVNDDIRPKLKLYQKEAAKALADHFFGRKQTHTPGLDALLESVKRLDAVVGRLARQIDSQPQARPISDLITVADRCRQRWPAAGPKHLRRVRDRAIGIYSGKYGGEYPLKLAGQRNGQIAFEREDLEILDRAIDQVMEEVTGNQVAPLFMRSGSN